MLSLTLQVCVLTHFVVYIIAHVRVCVCVCVHALDVLDKESADNAFTAGSERFR